MFITLSGITGVGKSYYKDKISKELNVKKCVILTTREKRIGEEEGIDKSFITNEKLEAMKKEGLLAYDFEYLGNRYAFLKEDVLSENIVIAEFVYSEIPDFKKVCPNIFTIYLVPQNIEESKKRLKARNINSYEEKLRLEEMEYQYKTFNEDKELQKHFEYVISNDYTKNTDKELIELIRRRIN